MGAILPLTEQHFRLRPQDREVIRPFLFGFDVTYADTIARGKALAAYFILKAEPSIRDLLGLERELLLVYSPYKQFDARAVQLHDAVVTTHRLRLDPIGSIVVSDDLAVASVLREVEAAEPDHPPMAAFTTKDLAAIADQSALRGALAAHFFRRDLFGIEAPLRNEALFFGRKELVTELLDRFRSGQNSGLFGLRRMGKTSVLYAMGRRCVQDGIGGFVYQDLSFPGLYEARWWRVLQLIVRAAVQGLVDRPQPAGIRAMKYDYSEDQAAYHFRNDMLKLLEAAPNRRMLFALDEIENVTFDLSPSMHWSLDFLPFWRTLRGFHQEAGERLCFIVAGVSPHLLEAEAVGRYDNPLFGTVRAYYVSPFSPKGTREMVRRLSRWMGIKPEEEIYHHLSLDYGGHPYLTRQACSYLVSRLPPKRPAILTSEFYVKEKPGLTLSLDKNVRQVLNALKRWYPPEYRLLRELAAGNHEPLAEALRQRATSVQHLTGYGLVAGPLDSPHIPVGLVRAHLASEPDEFSDLPVDRQSPEEVLSEIMHRRDPIERRFRTLISMTLSVTYGAKAPGRALDCFTKDRRDFLAGFGYREMWAKTFFKELVAVIEREWQHFEAFFGSPKADVLHWLNTVNEFRPDAHAGNVERDYLDHLRFCFRRLEEKIQTVPT
jgi:hypothetical protein